MMRRLSLASPLGLAASCFGRDPRSGPTPVYLTQWEGWDRGREQRNDPYDIVIDGQGNAYVAARSIIACRSSQTTARIYCSGEPRPCDGRSTRIFTLDLDSQGNVYVSDNANHRVQKFTLDRDLVFSSGEPRGGGGTVPVPARIAIDGRKQCTWRIASTTAYRNSRRRAVSSDSGAHRGLPLENFSFPRALEATPGGTVYVGDDLNHVQVFDSTGTYQSPSEATAPAMAVL